MNVISRMIYGRSEEADKLRRIHQFKRVGRLAESLALDGIILANSEYEFQQCLDLLCDCHRSYEEVPVQ